MSKLENLMRRHARVARERFYEDGELYAPLWLIENAEGQTLLLAAPTHESDDRDKHADMIRGAIREFGGVRYAFVSEAWFLLLEKDEPLRSPRRAKDRREALAMQGEDINGEQRTCHYEIKRHPGRKPTLGKADFGADFDGRYANMFSVGAYK